MARGSADTHPMSGSPAVLGKGLRVVGRVRGDGDLRVEADVEGDITVTGTLQIDEAAHVTGAVQADTVVVAGQLQGDATARTAVTISASGRVQGTVTAPALSLEEGGGLDGRIEADFELPKALA